MDPLEQARTDYRRYVAALADMEKERRPLQEALAALDQRTEGIRMILTGLERTFPELQEAPAPERATEARRVDRNRRTEPTGKSLVLRFLHMTENNGRWFLISEMVARMIDLGWIEGTVAENTNRIRIATLRLVETGEVEKEAVKADRNAFRYRLRSNIVELNPPKEGIFG